MATTHGLSRTGTYRVWKSMKLRCYHPRTINYAYYGGRGITVCDRWRNSFEAFLEDMGEQPFPGAELDREDSDGHYEAGNCRWVTHKQNINNRRDLARIEFKGHSLTASEWADKTGLPRKIISQRVRRGWSVEAALTTPLDTTKSHLKAIGV